MSQILIAVEGIDGSGKSTLVGHIADELRAGGHPVEQLATREPDKEPVFEAMVNTYALEPHSPAYMFLFQVLHAHKADRARKALEEGKVVITDRWDLSFFAWHDNFGFFNAESEELRTGVSRLAFDGLKPTLGIYLDVDVDKAIDRRLWRGEKIDDPESERQLYTTVVSAYRSLARRHGWIIIDANDGFEGVRDTAWKLVQDVVQKITPPG